MNFRNGKARPGGLVHIFVGTSLKDDCGHKCTNKQTTMTRGQDRTCNGSRLRKKQERPGQRRRHKRKDTGSAKDCGHTRTTADQRLDVHATSILCTNALCMQYLFPACLKAKWGWQRQASPHVRSLGVPVIRRALDRTRSRIEADRHNAASVAATISTKRPSPA